MWLAPSPRGATSAAAVWAFLALGATAQTNSPGNFTSALYPCPASCEGKPENWTVYSSVQRLEVCNQPILLDFAVYNPLDDPSTTVKLRTCTTGDQNDRDNALLSTTSANVQRSVPSWGLGGIARRNSSVCVANSETKVVNIDLAISNDQGLASSHNLQVALEQVQSYLRDSSNCDTKFIVSFARQAAVAVYSGSAIDNAATISAVIQQLLGQVGSSRAVAPKSVLAQLCGGGRTADYTFGIAIDTTGNLAAVQKSVKAWSDGVCAQGTQATSQLKDVSVVQSPLAVNGTVGFNGTVSSNGTFGAGGAISANSTLSSRRLYARGDCKTVSVVSGDSCGSLASKCGITAAQFTSFNPSSTLCSTLAVGQRVCCSSGTLPDLRPKPNPDGSCAVYTVQSGDFCSAIAAANGLQAADLDTFNDGTTWGWSGCNNLLTGIKICLSTGTPPLPAPVANALCGPTVPGSTAPSAGQSLANINPCPLNACCDIWGQCGVTPEYCNPTRGATNNPGTAPPLTNGCVSNCGNDIANQQMPSSFIKVGYYESWNWDRSCLNYRTIDLDGTDYTHVHWGFAALDASLNIIVNDTYNQMPDFIGLEGKKKILSFGGWGFSTDPSTFEILRTAMQPANRASFSQKIVNYLNANGFDGVDIDWEYPGAPDIPGIPPGLATDGPNYLAFLTTLRGVMPSGKTISIAAPASYWYLKAFPIAQMAKEVDYIVYMTYDLHGQWDYGNQFSQEGCPSGNCLRSHVNNTETMYALSMLTKAGISTTKITVGVSSYGRSFKMTQAGCSGPMCPFAGPDSQAAPGECTVTAGYISNAELEDIIDGDSTAVSTFDTVSLSDILVYQGNQWVAYMTDDTKVTRVNNYKALGFAGTVDWAVDLQQFTDDDGDPNDDDDEDYPLTVPLTPCTDTYTSIEALDAAADGIAMHCRPVYTIAVLQGLLTQTLNNYTDMVNNGYDKKFNTYAKAVSDSAGAQVTNFVMQNGNKYFTCVVAELAGCCSQCGSGRACNYCFNGDCTVTCQAGINCPKKRWEEEMLEYRETGPGNGGGGSTVTVDVLKWMNETEPCPPDYSQRGPGPDNPYEQTVYWTLSNGDQFYADLLTNTGIPKDKIGFTNVDRGQDCAPSSGPTDLCRAIGMDYNFPTPQGFTQADVTNPKDLVTAALSKVQALMPQMSDANFEMGLGSWYGDWTDLLDSVSMPIFMLAEAVENMQTIEDTADQIDEERRKAIILAFLGAILFFVPVVGEVVGSVAELGDIAAIISALGTAGNVAMDIYTLVSDPANAPLAIFDIVLSPLALADAAQLAKAANIRRGMSADDIAKLGEKVGTRMNTVKKLGGACIKEDA